MSEKDERATCTKENAGEMNQNKQNLENLQKCEKSRNRQRKKETNERMDGQKEGRLEIGRSES
jgi:hypothetical protein